MSEIYVFCLAAICSAFPLSLSLPLFLLLCDNKTKQNLRLDGSYDWEGEGGGRKVGAAHKYQQQATFANVANIECQIF